MRCVVTGGSGFVGAQVAAVARANGFDVLTPSRHELATARLLERGDVVVHCAGAAHGKRLAPREAERHFRQVNVELTLSLATRAVACGAKRFIFISSIKAMGEQTPLDRPFTASAALEPKDAYGRSKRDAELGITALSNTSSLEVCIIRPPLVYGPGVKANFRSLCEWIVAERPLPLRGIRNKRSLLGLSNLVALIVTCITHPNATNTTFLAADHEDLSTPELILRMANAANRSPRLFAFPLGMLEQMMGLVGKGRGIRRLRQSLRVDATETTARLGWQPTVPIDEELRATFLALLEEKRTCFF
jgi:nucleoside-diphosphate-sugar epimerase